MDFSLSPVQAALQDKARAFTQSCLYPFEEEVQEGDGLSQQSLAIIRDAVIAHGLNAMNHAVEDGGQGLSLLEQALVAEEVGKATNNLGLRVWMPAYCLRYATAAQKEKYLRPACRGELREAFLVSEPTAGSDARNVKTSAVKRGSRYVINGTKCFSSGSEHADYLLVHCNVDGDPDKATLFILDRGVPGFSVLKRPRAMYAGVSTHPWVALRDVEVDAAQILGEVGQGFELTKDWFVEQRANIGARCVGVAIRCAEIANEHATRRVQFGRPIRDFQAIEFKLADMAVEIMAAKSLLYRCAAEYDRGMDRKIAHARMSAVKLFCSEMAGRVCDQALQIQGGHGFMMDSPVARHYTSVRAERIVEGTSEIQRVIIGGQIAKRGMEVYTGLLSSESTD